MAIHKMTYRVPYADTDQMGVVYHANYLVYFERSRTEMFRDAGLPYSEIERRGYLLPVAEAGLKYKASAHYDELLTFCSWIKETKGIRLVIVSEVFRDGKLLVSGEVTLACADKNLKLTRIPPFILNACSKYLKYD